jgi:hypothetical protein
MAAHDVGVRSAMARAVVVLPPLIVTKPWTPAAAWSKHSNVRDSSWPALASSGRPMSGPEAAKTRGHPAPDARHELATALGT